MSCPYPGNKCERMDCVQLGCVIDRSFPPNEDALSPQSPYAQQAKEQSERVAARQQRDSHSSFVR